MYRAKSRAAWEHTSHILALVANVNRDPKKRSEPFAAEDFNPFADRREPTDDDARAEELAARINRLMTLPAVVQRRMMNQWQSQESEPERPSSN